MLQTVVPEIPEVPEVLEVGPTTVKDSDQLAQADLHHPELLTAIDECGP